MCSTRLRVAFQLISALGLSGCLVPVTEKQCDDQTPCGSSWRCVDGVCFPPAGGSVGDGGGTDAGTDGGPLCGCKDSSGNCWPGDVVSTCGTGGARCSACGPAQTCNQGVCTSNSCTPSTCDSGCCRAGSCVPTSAQSSLECGLGAQTCAACPSGQSCVGGQCKLACNSANCTGCCSGTICLMPTPTSCGFNGSSCVACPAGYGCSTGVCLPTCTSANCATGCCRNGICMTGAGQSNANCGSGGNQCTTCSSGSTCTSGTCVGGKKIGSSCTTSGECAVLGAGAYCKFVTSTGNAFYTNGFCTRACSLDGGTACTVDSVCLNALQPYGENDSLCAPRCSVMSECRMPGYACYFINTVATTACWLNPIPGSSTGDAGSGPLIGAACANAGQCTNPSNAFCIQDVIPGLGASGFVGGYCSSLCNTVACAAGSTCKLVTAGAIGVSEQLCLRDCLGPRTGQSSCRNGYVCEGTPMAAMGVCLPRCNNSGASCPMGTACNTMTGYCG